jgi:hypothetical protein
VEKYRKLIGLYLLCIFIFCLLPYYFDSEVRGEMRKSDLPNACVKSNISQPTVLFGED